MLRAAGVQKRKKCLGNNIVEIPPCILFVFSSSVPIISEIHGF